jgi:hypothetical protein
MLMLAEWWAAESIILLGGSLRNGPLNVAVLSIYQTVNAVAYMVSYGVHVAANTRVGNHLGRYATLRRTQYVYSTSTYMYDHVCQKHAQSPASLLSQSNLVLFHWCSGDAPMAKLSAYVAPFLGAIVGALMACILKILGPYYPYAFTSTYTGPCHTRSPSESLHAFEQESCHSGRKTGAMPSRSPSSISHLPTIRRLTTCFLSLCEQRTRRWCR